MLVIILRNSFSKVNHADKDVMDIGEIFQGSLQGHFNSHCLYLSFR